MRQVMFFALAGLGLFGSTTASLAQSAPSPFTSAMRYDAVGREIGSISADPDGAGAIKFAATRATYDARTLLVKTEKGELLNWQGETVLPAAWIGFTVLSSMEIAYDVNRRKIRETAKGSNGLITAITQYSYDARGRLECSAQRMNPAIYSSLPVSACTLGTAGASGPDRITRNVYDAADQLLKLQKAVGTPLQQDYATYTYSPNGKQTSVKDANGNLASLTYDGHDRQVRWSFPSKTAVGTVSTTDYEEYAYDANGNRTSLRKRDGSIIRYQYDALNRNTVKIVPERAGLLPTHTRDVYYGYDLRGLQISARFDSAAGQGITNAYDGFGRMTSSSINLDGNVRTLTHAHDKNGNRTRVTHPDGQTFFYQYDGLDRMTAYLQGTTALGSMAYNNRGLMASMAGGVPTVYGYDLVGRMNALSHNLGGTATTHDVAYGFTFNPASQVATRSVSNDAYAYTAEPDVVRNYGVNGLNQYTGVSTNGGAAFGYDANGNLTYDGASTFLYDVENRLVQSSGPRSATLRYDPLGRLYETSAGTAGSITRFHYDGDELVGEYSAPAASAPLLLRRYVHGAGVDDPLVWMEGAGVTAAAARRLRGNHQGSIVAVADNAGAPIAINAYDEWGIPAATNVGRFQYTGQIWLPELGLYYYKARIYSPTLGRFMQTDPIGYEDQVNLYAYVGNDPVNGRDPDGKRNKPCDGACSKRIKASNRKAQRRATAERVAAQRKESSRASTGSSLVGATATAQGTIGEAAGKHPGEKGIGLSAVKGMGKLIGVGGTALEAKSQLDEGKSGDKVAANVAGQMGFSATVAAVATQAAPATVGGSVAVGAIVIGADLAFGGAVGNAAEAAYDYIKENGPEIRSRPNGVFPY